MKPEDVRVMSPYMGGGFGSGLRPQYQVVLAVLGGAGTQRPVRLVLTRQQMYAGLSSGHDRAPRARRQRGRHTRRDDARSDRDDLAIRGVLAQRHRLVELALQVPQRQVRHKLVRLDVPTSADMRAPGAATGVYALECAMDELAVALKLDPLELRLRCYSDRDQN